MKRYLLSCVGVIAALLSISACQREPVTDPSVGSDILSEPELGHLTESAEQGDADAAYRVAIHYEADPNQEGRAVEWLTVAANLNHDVATQHLVVILMGRGGADCERALVWLRRLDERVTDPQARGSLGIDEMLSDPGSCSLRPSE